MLLNSEGANTHLFHTRLWSTASHHCAVQETPRRPSLLVARSLVETRFSLQKVNIQQLNQWFYNFPEFVKRRQTLVPITVSMEGRGSPPSSSLFRVIMNLFSNYWLLILCATCVSPRNYRKSNFSPLWGSQVFPKKRFLVMRGFQFHSMYQDFGPPPSHSV